MKIFVCKKCQKYCNVAAGMLSDCCKANIFIPLHNKENIKKKINPAL